MTDVAKTPNPDFELSAIDKNARRTIACPDADLSVKVRGDSRTGSIEGHAAVWDKVDLQNEIIRKGTFTKSIEESVKQGKVKLMTRHFAYGGDVMEVIGTVKEAREDDFGLWFRAPLSSIRRAQEVRELVKEQHVTGSSVGFLPVRWGFMDVAENQRKIIEHTEAKLVEITVTARPAMPDAVITAKIANGATVNDLVTEFEKSLDAVFSSWSPQDGRLQDEGTVSQAKRLLEDLSSLQAKVEELLKEPPQAPVVEKQSTERRLHRVWTEIERYRLSLAKFDLK